MIAQRVELPAHSAFVRTPVYSGLKVEIDGASEPVVAFGLMLDAVVADDSDELFTVTVGLANRLDLISDQFYGTKSLWWVVAMVNNQLDPLVGFVPGDLIRIPKKSRLSVLGLLNS